MDQRQRVYYLALGVNLFKTHHSVCPVETRQQETHNLFLVPFWEEETGQVQVKQVTFEFFVASFFGFTLSQNLFIVVCASFVIISLNKTWFIQESLW